MASTRCDSLAGQKKPSPASSSHTTSRALDFSQREGSRYRVESVENFFNSRPIIALVLYVAIEWCERSVEWRIRVPKRREVVPEAADYVRLRPSTLRSLAQTAVAPNGPLEFRFSGPASSRSDAARAACREQAILFHFSDLPATWAADNSSSAHGV